MWWLSLLQRDKLIGGNESRTRAEANMHHDSFDGFGEGFNFSNFRCEQ